MALLRFLVVTLTVVCLAACTDIPVKSVEKYQLHDKQYLYQRKIWSFDGRLSVSDGKESWSAAIEWKHTENKDEIKLSGPLGQGAAVVTLMGERVVIDRGDGKIQRSEQVDEFIEQQLGVFVPVRALRYWVLGVPQLGNSVVEVSDGFRQEKWDVHYLQMQKSRNEWLPRKINVEQGESKVKLVIDQWVW